LAKFLFELVSPERLVLSEPVDMVVVPGAEGNFGVLAGHSLLISTVRPGVIDGYEGTAVTDRIFVAGGFAEVTPDRCTVLADEAVAVKDLDATAVEANLRHLEGAEANLKEHANRATGADKDAALLELKGVERNLAVAQAKLAALRTAPSAGAAH
jgi:F-type H+-transporting ATPase subunit epsilon